MKISPTAIRQKVFETSFRGFEKKQVTDFLEEMSVAMEQINQENLELRSRLQQVEGEAKRLKDVEDSLFRTLKTAEDTGAAIINEASEAADQIIAEANQLAEQTTQEAQRYAEQLATYSKEQSRLITQAAEENAKETMRELIENVKGLIKSYEGLAEQREALVKSLRRLSQDALNQIDLSETHFSRIDAKAYQYKAEEQSRTNYFSAANVASFAPQGNASPVDSLPEVEEPQNEAQHQISEESVESNLTQDLDEEDLISEENSISEEEFVAATPADSVELQVEADQEEAFEEELANMPEIQSEEIDQEESSTLPEDQKKEDNKPASGSFFDQFD
jgi:cell division initiation protein